MTSVLYRAKAKDTLEWVEGYYAKANWYLTYACYFPGWSYSLSSQ